MSRGGFGGQIPTSLRRGNTVRSRWSASATPQPRRTFTGSAGTRGTPGRDGRSTADVDSRNRRYFPGLYSDLLGEGDVAGQQAALDAPLPGSGMRRDLVKNEEEAIMALMFGGGGLRGAIDRAIQLSLTDNDAFTQLQFQLMQHGFYTSEGGGIQPNFGEMDNATAAAITTLVQEKMRVGADVSMSAFLDDKRKGWFDQTFADMSDDLAAVDEAKAAELEALKEQIENVDLSVALTSTEALKNDIQERARDEIGRALSDTEVQSIIDSVHEQERKDFWANSPTVRAYNNLRSQWEDAVSNDPDKVAAVIGGEAVSDLDAFLNATIAVESGGNPNAVNKDSGAFGLFQFMPGTWKDTTRKAGLDPNDKSAENQKAAARFLAASYFKALKSWRQVARAWYSGFNSDAVKTNGGAGNSSQGKYPTINAYADRIVNIMGSDPLDASIDAGMAAADAGSLGALGPNQGEIDPVMLNSWWNKEQKLSLGGDRPGLSDLPSSQNTEEYESWDMDAYLRSAVREKGGVDTDVFGFAQNALRFYEMLGPR